MRSGFEEKVKKFLQKLKQKFSYEKAKLPYTIPAKEANYIPDFVLGVSKNSLTKKDLKGKIVIEAKGRFTLQDRRKMLLVKEKHPDLDIRIVLQSDNYLTKLTKKQKQKKKQNIPFKKDRYSDWCKKHGFKYHVDKDGKIPKEWLD